MHSITSIVSVRPYIITVVFDDKEQREIDFATILQDFPALKKPEVFSAATLDDYPTLKWEGLAKIRELDGRIVPAPLDFSPDVLYAISKSI